MGLLVGINAKIAAHAALTTAIHGVGSLHVAGFQSAGQALSKVIWRPTVGSVVSDSDRTVTLDWTDVDISYLTGDNAKFAILLLRSKVNTVGTGSYALIGVRKNGETPSYYPLLKPYQKAVEADDRLYEFVIVGLDSDQVLEYKIELTAGWDIDTDITLLGHIE